MPDPIRPGQVWESRDKRDHGRRVTVEAVDMKGAWGRVTVRRGARLSPMTERNLRTRYRLISDPEETPDA